MTEFIGQVTLFIDDQDPSTFENVGHVKLFRELVGEVKLSNPFDTFIPPDVENETPDHRMKHDKITVTEQNILDKKFLLTKVAYNPSTVIFLPQGGIPQFIEEDFMLTGNVLSWEGLGLDGFIEKDDVIHVYYH